MQDVDVHPLPQLAVADDLRQLNAHGVLVDVEDDARLAVEERVRHTLLDGGVHLDVHVVAALEGLKIPRDARHALLPIILGKLVAGAMTEAPGNGVQLAHGLFASNWLSSWAGRRAGVLKHRPNRNGLSQ